MSWYDRQLVENSRSSDSKQAKPSKVDKEGSYGPSEGQGGSVAEVDACDGGSGVMSPSPQLRGGDVDVGIGFGEREMSGEASVMATLKVDKVDIGCVRERKGEGAVLRSCVRTSLPW